MHCAPSALKAQYAQTPLAFDTHAVTDASSSPKDSPVLDFKSATLYAVRVVLQSADSQELVEALSRRMADAKGFFDDETVVVDTSALTQTIDWTSFIKALRDHGLRPIGAVGDAANLALARKAGLEAVELSHGVTRSNVPPPASAQANQAPVGNSTAASSAPAPAAKPEASQNPADEAPAPSGSEPAPTMVIERPLRSGQRVYARNADLVVVGMVSQGAEVIADGNIHVYGPLRGKAMAGARGDTSARIFTTQLNPELLAIAGVYRVIESALESHVLNHPAIVQLGGETLQIVPVGTKG